MKERIGNNACRDIWKAIIDRDYRAWKGLPDGCTYSDFDASFTRLRDEYGKGSLGKARRQAMFRMYVAEGYPHNLKVWFSGDRIFLIESKYPVLPYPSRELVQHLGDPEIRLDYYLDIMPIPGGAWIYAAKGIALFLDRGYSAVMRVALFRPCSMTEYLEEIHPDTRLWERPK